MGSLDTNSISGEFEFFVLGLVCLVLTNKTFFNHTAEDFCLALLA